MPNYTIKHLTFRRDADELESWIHEKLQVASDESYKDPTNLQAKIQKHQAFEVKLVSKELNHLGIITWLNLQIRDYIKQIFDWRLLFLRLCYKMDHEWFMNGPKVNLI